MADCESDFDYYSGLTSDIDRQFPDAPFSISCVRRIEELDEKFTDERVIFIRDDRASPANYYYDNIPGVELHKFNNFTKVEASNAEYITIRDILLHLINDKHYHDEVVVGDPHGFLDGFQQSQKSKIQYSIIWGS